MKKVASAFIIALLTLSAFSMVHLVPSVKAALNWNIQTVDSSAPNDEYIISSIDLDSSGVPHIAYSGYQGQLKYASWTGATWAINNAGFGGSGQEYPSLALDSGDTPHISYTAGGYLEYATYAGSWSSQAVDTWDGEDGRYCSMKLDSNEYPHICYVADVGDLDVKYAAWTGSEWSTEYVATSGYTGFQRTSLALDSNDKPHACWYHPGMQFMSPTVFYANKMGDTWSTPVAVDSDLDVGSGGCSIALDSFDRPCIAYYDDYFDGIQSTGSLKLARWTGTTWSIETVDSYMFNYDHVGEYPCLFMDYMDRPHISYYDYWSSGSTNYWALKYARWTGTAWSTEFVDGNNLGVADWSSLVVSQSGTVHISYCDRTIGDLKYATTTIPDFDSHEYFFQVFYDALDTDGDEKNDAIKVTMDVDSTYGGTQKVTALVVLRDFYEQNCAYNYSTWSITDALYDYGEATVYVPPDESEGWYDVILILYDNGGHFEDQRVDENVAYLFPPPSYSVTIWAWDVEGWIAEPITMDGNPTGFSTPYTFTYLTGTHTFTVPSTDILGYPFGSWNTGETSTTITVTSGGTYTAQYYPTPTLSLENVQSWYWADDTVIESVATGNVDGDSEVEVVTGGYNWDGIRYTAQLCIWNGATLSLENVLTWYWTSTTLINSVAAGDVDGDAQMEIVTGGYYRDGTRSYSQLCVWNGATLALENVETWYWAGDTEIVTVALYDVDADGKVEIVTGGSYYDGVYIAQLCVWDGATLALENVTTWYWTGFTYINSVGVGDVDGDSKTEIVTGGVYWDGSRFNAQLCVWNGANLALESVTTWYWTGSTFIYSVGVGDVDGDTKIEIVTAGNYNDGTRLVAQLCVWDGATLGFENVLTWYWTSNTDLNSVAIVDVDGDAQLEIITGGSCDDGIRSNSQLCIWNGATLALEIAETWYWTGNTSIGSVAIHDVDGDVQTEIVTGGNYYDGTRIVAQLCIWGAT